MGNFGPKIVAFFQGKTAKKRGNFSKLANNLYNIKQMSLPLFCGDVCVKSGLRFWVQALEVPFLGA